MRRKKGFTLMELIVVIAIMTILLAIIVPAWAYYLQRARVRSQNLKAKSIFNAAQTVVTDLQFEERHYVSIWEAASGLNGGVADGATKTAAEKHIYTRQLEKADTEKNEWYFYWNNGTGFRCDADCAPVTYSGDAKRQATIDEWNKKISAAVNKIVDENDQTYRIYVSDYKVMSVACARSDHDRFIGSYPMTYDQLLKDGSKTKSEVDNIQSHGITSVVMDDLV